LIIRIPTINRLFQEPRKTCFSH